MSSFIREHPLSIRNNRSLFRDSFFDEVEDEFFNHPLIQFPSIYPYHHFYHPMSSLHNQLSKAFDSDVFKSVDFSPKINLSEDDKKYYIHADLPGMTKDQVKMELSEEDHVLTISGERETVIDDSKDDDGKNSESATNSEAKSETTSEVKCNDGANETKGAENKEGHKEEKSKENNYNNKNKKYSRIECSYGKFSRSFSLPENADIESIQAKMENGVLEVTLNKIVPQEKEQKRTIQIQ